MKLCRKITAEGGCVTAVLHDLSLAFHFADNLIVLEKGKVRMQGSAQEVYESGIVREVFGVELIKANLADGSYIYCTREI
jgi:iron complex transport system ATP-binding protein